MSILDPQQNGAMTPFGEGAIPPQLDFPLAANAQGGKLQFITIDPSTGLASPADDNTPGQISAGLQFPDELSAKDAGNGNATVRVMERAAVCLAPSTIANDGFSAADVGCPVWIADTNTPGKLSHTSTKNRSLGGFFLGLVAYGSTGIRFIGGVVGQLLGRAAMMADAVLFGQHHYAVDAGDATDLTEIQFSEARAPLHGVITGIEFIANATLAATGGTNFKTLTVTKYAADGTTPVVVGTMTTVLVTTKWVAKSFTLSAVAGALNILEGDTFTIKNGHDGSGATTPAGVIRIIGKAI